MCRTRTESLTDAATVPTLSERSVVPAVVFNALLCIPVSNKQAGNKIVSAKIAPIKQITGFLSLDKLGGGRVESHDYREGEAMKIFVFMSSDPR